MTPTVIKNIIAMLDQVAVTSNADTMAKAQALIALKAELAIAESDKKKAAPE